MGVKYNNYLKSDWWKSLRQKRLKKNDKCEACGNKNYLHIHHYNYEHKYAGKSHKAIKHTKVLCSLCHKTFHEIYGVKKDMTKEMKEFLNEALKGRKLRRELFESQDWIKNI